MTVDLATGLSKGDGHDTLQGFEDVVGSPQGDKIIGDSEFNRIDGGVGNDDLDGGGGPDEAFGGAGTDECDGFATEHSCGVEENPPANATFVILNQGLDGSSLIVQGDSSANHIVRLLQRRLDRHQRRPDRRRRRLPARQRQPLGLLPHRHGDRAGRDYRRRR